MLFFTTVSCDPSDLKSKLLSLYNDGWTSVQLPLFLGVDRIYIHAFSIIAINLATQLICVHGVYLIISGNPAAL